MPDTATDSEPRLPPDAHVRTMELLKNPPREPMVAIMPHRGLHDTEPAHAADSDIGEHTRASIYNAPAKNFALLELDAKYGYLVHGNTWGLNADVGAHQGLPPFNVADVTSDQSAVNPPVLGSTWEGPRGVKDFKLRGASGATTDEPPLNVTTALQIVAREKLPVNLVFDCKTFQDVLDVPEQLAFTNHFDGRPFIETAMVKILLADMKTPADYDNAFNRPGPDGKPIGDKLNVVWVVRPNDIEQFGSEQGIIDALEAHRATGRFSITELNIKDDKGLHEVAKWVRESGQVWLGSYHPTRESDLRQTGEHPLAKGDWNTVTDKKMLYELGNESVLLLPNGTCCHSINSDLFGSEYDQRISAARLKELGTNFITTDTPEVVRDFFKAQGIPDISHMVMRQPQLDGRPGAATGWSSQAQVGVGSGVLIASGLGYLAMKKPSLVHKAVNGLVRAEMSMPRLPTLQDLQSGMRNLMGSRATPGADAEAGHPLEILPQQRRGRELSVSSSSSSDDGRPQQRNPGAPRPGPTPGAWGERGPSRGFGR